MTSDETPAVPERKDYASEADYIDAVQDYYRALLTPAELKIRREYIQGVADINSFLAWSSGELD